MDRQQFLRLLVATPVLTLLFGAPAAARGGAPTPAEALRQADLAVDLAYDKCATGGWARAYQRDYLRATLEAVRAYERHDPDSAYGQNYYRLAVDLAADLGWDPRSAAPEEVRLLERAAEFTRAHPGGDRHVERATALLKAIRRRPR